jgi:hypothetical protein
VLLPSASLTFVILRANVILVSRSPERSEGAAKDLSAHRENHFAALRKNFTDDQRSTVILSAAEDLFALRRSQNNTSFPILLVKINIQSKMSSTLRYLFSPELHQYPQMELESVRFYPTRAGNRECQE